MYKFRYNNHMSKDDAILLVCEKTGTSNIERITSIDFIKHLESKFNLSIINRDISYLLIDNYFQNKCDVYISSHDNINNQIVIVKCNMSLEDAKYLLPEDSKDGVLLENDISGLSYESEEKDPTKTISEGRKREDINYRFAPPDMSNEVELHRAELLNKITKEFSNKDRSLYDREAKILLPCTALNKKVDLIDYLIDHEGFVKCTDGKYICLVLYRALRANTDNTKCIKPHNANPYHFISNDEDTEVKAKLFSADNISPDKICDNLLEIYRNIISSGEIKIDASRFLSIKENTPKNDVGNMTCREVKAMLDDIPPSMLDTKFNDYVEWYNKNFK